MANRDENQEIGKYQFNLSGLVFLPIIFTIMIVPLMVRMSIQELTGDMEIAFRTKQVFDFFSQYKAGCLMLVAGVILITTFLVFQKKNVKWDKSIKIYTIGLGIYILFTSLSAMFSQHKDVALWGAPDRAEGLIILVCYAVLMLYTIYALRKVDDVKFIIIPLAVLTLIMVVLGAYQYFGKDLLFTNFGKKLIVPEAYAELRGALSLDYEKGKIYGTMFHYNYMGSFGAMIVPLFGVLLLTVSGMKNKIVFGIMTVASLFLLLGSTSRAGLIGVVCSGIVFVIVFAKYLIKKWKLVTPLVVALVALLFVFDAVTGGTIFERIPTLIQDAVAIVQQPAETGSYKDHIPLRAVESREGKLHLTTQADELILSFDGEQLTFIDQNGQVVEYVLNEGQYTTGDTRFSNIVFQKTPTTDKSVEDGIYIIADGVKGLIAKMDTQDGVYLIHNYTGQRFEIVEAPYIGFEGKEQLGSSRGYIWSRSLPMLKDTLFLGYGPDTYILEFPQDDYLAKWYAYGTPLMTVDKPHNLYLQIALNQGVIALLGFLVIVITYIVDSLRLYAFKGFYNRKESMGIALALAIIGYLGAGLFNDSIISVAPIFWVLLGTGITVNYFMHEEKRQQREISKVIALKNRK